MHLNILFLLIAVGGLAVSSSAVPTSSFMPVYPIQQTIQTTPEVVVTKPIQTAPTLGYGTISQPTIVPTEIIIINGCPACR